MSNVVTMDEPKVALHNPNRGFQKVSPKYLPLDEVIFNEEENLRKTYKDVEEIAESILVDGQIIPIKVEKLPNGKYRGIEGFTRNRAVKLLLEQGRLPENFQWRCEVVDFKGDEVQRIIFSVKSNNLRHNLSAIEEADAYIMLQNEYGMKQKDIAASFNKEPSYISTMLKLAKSGGKTLELAKEGKMAGTVAAHLIAVHKEEADEVATLAQRIAQDSGSEEVKPVHINEAAEAVSTKAKPPKPLVDERGYKIIAAKMEALEKRFMNDDKQFNLCENFLSYFLDTTTEDEMYHELKNFCSTEK